MLVAFSFGKPVSTFPENALTEANRLSFFMIVSRLMTTKLKTSYVPGSLDWDQLYAFVGDRAPLMSTRANKHVHFSFAVLISAFSISKKRVPQTEHVLNLSRRFSVSSPTVIVPSSSRRAVLAFETWRHPSICVVVECLISLPLHGGSLALRTAGLLPVASHLAAPRQLGARS
jgi:hypothetical protein